MKNITSVVLAFSLLASPLLAGAQQEKVVATVGPSGHAVTIPAQAVEVAPNVFSIGSKLDPQSGKMVEGYMFIHKKNGNAKPSGNPGGGSQTCYGFLASGAKWKGAAEPWFVNSANSGLDGATVFSILTNDMALWEDAADGKVNGVRTFDILGNGTPTTSALSAETSAPDGMNEALFGNLNDMNTIAVTTVWGVFGGPERNRQLVEWDQVYNTQYSWATDNSQNAMDFQNLSTHELGHAFGLSDLYQSGCATQTMYGYGAAGETQKRTLESGDIMGISTLY